MYLCYVYMYISELHRCNDAYLCILYIFIAELDQFKQCIPMFCVYFYC